MTTFKVSGYNDFHSGWLAYVLGETPPKKGSFSASWLEGWNTAFETDVCRRIGEAFKEMRALGQVTVSHVNEPDSPRPS